MLYLTWDSVDNLFLVIPNSSKEFPSVNFILFSSAALVILYSFYNINRN
ncbi:hypothetical protein [Bacillus phage FI_KG-Lek]|nr:hypothetical protein [Bacillus phage FI_KG-Lek]